MDTRRTPPILRQHATDEVPQLGVGTGTSWLAGDSSPVGTIRSSVPGHHGGGFDDDEALSPSIAEPSEPEPEDAGLGSQPRGGVASPVEDDELLAERQILCD